MTPIYKIMLFDVDGVLIIPPKLFSQQYCEKYGKDEAKLEGFYATPEFRNASLGKSDLKDAIRQHDDLWQWDGEPDELLDMWFEAENCPNVELLEEIQKLRKQGRPLYLATQQEKYRAAYLRDVVFDGKIDGMFCTCDIGYGKQEDSYWKAILSKLKTIYPDVASEEIIFFDDRVSLVDKAKEFGISAFLYKNNAQAKSLLT
jgi:FMN phosphatase YigB (HAD superfamily)